MWCYQQRWLNVTYNMEAPSNFQWNWAHNGLTELMPNDHALFNFLCLLLIVPCMVPRVAVPEITNVIDTGEGSFASFTSTVHTLTTSWIMASHSILLHAHRLQLNLLKSDTEEIRINGPAAIFSVSDILFLPSHIISQTSAQAFF